MQDIFIYGCGGFGREVLQVVRAINEQKPTWNVRAFVVGQGVDHPETVHGLKVIEESELDTASGTVNFAIGIGDPNARARIVAALGPFGVEFPTLVHPRAWIGDCVKLGPGVIVCACACLTTDIEIGDHVHVNLSATIGHDANIGAFSTISPGANISGNVTFGTGVEIGTGATVIQGIAIGDHCVIGASAAVVREIPSYSTAVGVPAKVISSTGKPG